MAVAQHRASLTRPSQALAKSVAHDEAGSELRQSRILASTDPLHPTLLSLANPHRGLSGAGLPYQVYGTVPGHVTLIRGLNSWDAELFSALVRSH